CVAVEYLITRFMLGQKPSIGNLSAVLTGLLLALNLPSNLPVWMILIGCVVAIGIGKMTFGGLGCNIFNPALVGRVFLLLSFPVAMTTWPLPEVNRMAYTDATTGATVLSQIKMGVIEASDVNLVNSLLGNMGGSLGEVGAIALLIGFVYLLVFKVISWHIPVSILLTVAVFSWLIGAPVGVELLSGGLLLGAIFMATDYVTSPMCHSGMVVYGVMIGLITIIIRQWGAYPEGMSFAILIMNGVTPLINRYIKPRKFGERRVAA
ncbi:MAG: RnfABCDGE type electron transport complex subunit D, partial [Duncaniella sp.]|nr:RnfABCDGE type electron transport complex subunit D [Duncaniella sp.]